MIKALKDKIGDPNITRIYLATLGLGTAYGMAISVIAVFLTARGYQETDIGSLAAWLRPDMTSCSRPLQEAPARCRK